MDQRPNVSLTNPGKPSRLLALIALLVAFSLPFILVKTFPHKQSPVITRDSVSLSEFDENDETDEEIRNSEAIEETLTPEPEVDHPKTTTNTSQEIKKVEIQPAKPQAPAPKPIVKKPESGWLRLQTSFCRLLYIQIKGPLSTQVIIHLRLE